MQLACKRQHLVNQAHYECDREVYQSPCQKIMIEQVLDELVSFQFVIKRWIYSNIALYCEFRSRYCVRLILKDIKY